MMATVVVKLGGSLLHQADWVPRFRRWLDRQPPAHYALLVGGGEMIEGLRLLSQTHPLHEEQMHWRCVRALDATYEIALELLPEARPLECPRIWKAKWPLAAPIGPQEKSMLWMAKISLFYQPLSSSQPVAAQASHQPWPLPPHNWNTTSDTIAALLGRLLDAQKIILLKSCAVPDGLTIAEATATGIVDSALQGTLSPQQVCEIQQLPPLPN